jgi:20S proteasome alpha/beta subunit
MTVVVGFVTSDAAVMASDSEATSADGTRSDMDKIWTCGTLLLGYTGSSIVRQPLEHSLAAAVASLEAAGRTPSRWDYRASLCDATRNVLEGEYANHLGERDQWGFPLQLRGALLAIGRDADGLWLLEVDHTPGGTFYEQDGFHAVGSGSIAAQVTRGLLAHYYPVGQTVAHLRLIAYRTVAACIDVLGGGHGVGGKVAIWEQSEAGFEKLSDPELEQAENGVAQWTTIEAETLDAVISRTETPSEGVEMPEALAPESGSS